MKKALFILLLLAGTTTALIINDVPASVLTGSYWNITGSKYMINNSGVLDVDEDPLNTTIGMFIESTTYNVSVLDVQTGTLDYGDVNSVKYRDDGLNISISEVTGAYPILVDFNFTGVSDFNQFLLNVYYDGSVSHNIQVGLYECGDDSYEYEYITFTGHDGYVNLIDNVLDASGHICDGVVSLRLRHIENGNTAHNLYIDYVALVKGFTGITTNSHDSLQDRQDFINNHPLYADNLTDLEGRVITLEAGGGGGGDWIPYWIEENDKITSNASINDGNVDVSGNITVNDVFHIVESGGLPQHIFMVNDKNLTVSIIGDGTYSMTTGHEAGVSSPHTYARSAGTGIRFYGDTHASETDANFNYTELNHQGGRGNLLIGKGNLRVRLIGTEKTVYPHNDNTHHLGCLSTDTDCSSNLRWAKIEAVNMGSGDFSFMNEISITECSTDYGRDLCFVGSRPTAYMNELIGIAGFENFSEYQNSHRNDTGHYVGHYTEEEFNINRAMGYINGEMDFLFGRTSYFSIRQAKGVFDRQVELIQILYDNGLISLNQRNHLRDDF